jgi:hypothetical protein
MSDPFERYSTFPTKLSRQSICVWNVDEVSYYQDAREEERRPPHRWASVRLSRLFLSLKTISSTAAVPTMYSIFYLY